MPITATELHYDQDEDFVRVMDKMTGDSVLHWTATEGGVSLQSL